MSKKKIFVIVLLIVLILAICANFYTATSYYKLTDEALNAKLIRIDKSFSLEKSAATVTANGKLMNITDSTLEVEAGEIILYCEDTSTNELLSFKNATSYHFAPSTETTIYIPIFKGDISTENSQYASNILKNYKIVKIEYQESKTAIYQIKTIAETGSRFVPLGIIIILPILIIMVAMVSIILFFVKKNQTFNSGEKPKLSIIDLKLILKSLPFSKKILLLILNSMIFLFPILAGIIALNDEHWSVTTFIIVVVIMSACILVNLFLISILVIHKIIDNKKYNLTKKIKPSLQYLLDIKQKEVNNGEPTTKIPETYCKTLNNHQENLTKYEQAITEYKQSITTKERSISSLQSQIETVKKEMLRLEIKQLQTLDGWQFEDYCANLYRKLGYSVRKTKGSGDFGADLILNNSISVQCKLYSNPVGIRALQEVYSSMVTYKTNKACVITNNKFTPQAIAYAQDAHIELIDGVALKSLISKVTDGNNQIILKNNERIKKLSSEIVELRNKISDMNTKFYEEKRAINNIEAEINELPEIQSILREIKGIKADLLLLANGDYRTTKEIGRKYNLL
jgi:HJR/Mrr/RecB family endonuclease